MSEVVERIEEVCGLYFRSIVLKNTGDLGTKHAHNHDHATLVCSGRARFICDGVVQGDYDAGTALLITAGRLHQFQALEPNTRLACVHDVASAQAIKEKGL